MIASTRLEGTLHFHIKTVSLIGLNVSRPLAVWVQEEIEPACWSQGRADNTAVEAGRVRP